MSFGGSDTSRSVGVVPTGRGYSNITIRVTDGDGNHTDATLQYAASAASLTPATTRYFAGSSDASTAQDVGGGYMLVGDDENQALRLYNTSQSGLPVASFDFTSSLGLTDISGGVPREVDIEASARVGNVIYWLGSESNSSSGNPRPNRDRVFATQVNGSGASTTLSFLGYYDHLKEDLVAWDQANGNQFGFAAGTQSGLPPEDPSLSGYNIEGLEFAPGSSTTAYLAFRAPIVPGSNRTKALIVPVTNFSSLFSGSPATGPATFGSPMQFDLGGRGIREIRKNAADQYLIIAGPATDTGSEALYTWDGNPAHAPSAHPVDLTTAGSDGPYEGVVSLPNPLNDSSSLQLLADSGGTDWYGDGQAAKDLAVENFKKARTDIFTLGSAAADQPPVNTVPGAQTTNEDTALVFSTAHANAISVADPDAGTSAVQVTLSATHGTLTLASTTNLTVAGERSASVVVTGALTDINAALNGLSYLPAANYNGPATVQVSTNDQGNTGTGGPLTDTDSVSVTVVPVNDPPVASDASVSTNEDTALTFSPTVVDVDGDATTNSVVAGAAHGSVVVNGDGSFTYTPASNFNGSDSFTYKANDGLVDSNVATVSVTVVPVNDPPVASDASVSTNEDTALTFSPTVVDVDGDATTNSVVAGRGAWFGGGER